MIDQDKMRALAARLRVTAKDRHSHGLLVTAAEIDEAADAIDLLLTEVEATAVDKRDAERYRALRDFGKDGVKMKPPVEHVHAMIYRHAVGAIPGSCVATGDELDRAIDAALAQRQGERS
ncbi:hypothetical protein [Burkholderia sp. NRF60-BP8]|uniref:hypothetical protein n=1 Tax=Burkholderia sp. NRF60-BP8 TaxID=1637853 RepID=UPI0007572131|nr:hypothetical protein [Burkholderia sp. NRF60-BP8]AOI76093.1 hypothetical protein WS54_07280 [Burkholderia sp. NRF60-BP8]KVA07099.1 hypothetical protein WS54_23325 [Burkholderia sp. NRF60-BP8]